MKRLAQAYHSQCPFGNPWLLLWREIDPANSFTCTTIKGRNFKTYEEMMLFADLNGIEVVEVHEN